MSSLDIDRANRQFQRFFFEGTSEDAAIERANQQLSKLRGNLTTIATITIDKETNEIMVVESRKKKLKI